MTHVLYFGVTDFTLQMQTIQNETQKLQRIIFPQNKFSKDPTKTSKKGEQELCFINVVCSEQNTFLIDTQYELWGFGNSQFFQLGLQQPSVVQPINISQITKNQYRQVSGGSGFIAAYSTNKKIYMWGNLHQLSYGDIFRHSEKQVQSEQIDTYYAISQVDITPNYSIIKHPEQERRSLYQIVHQADLIQLKCVGTTTYLLTPNKLHCLGLQQQFPVQFVGLACSQKHVLGWDEFGKVWSWGEFADGKLGYMDFQLKEQTTPRQIDHFQIKIVQCACGANYSIALDVKGDIYGWGKGPFQMDLSKAVIPMKLCQKQKPFIKIIAGESHFGALDLFGQLYCWGINVKSCLGDLPERSRFPQLFDLQNLKVIDAAMGNSVTVIIVPANPSYRLPSLNVDQYTSYQQKRVKEEAALMKDFAERKNKIDQIQSQPQTQVFCETPMSMKTNTEYEKTANLLQKMKSQVDSLKGQPKFKSITRSLRLETDVLSYQTQLNQDYDDVLQKLKQLEYQNYLYIPVCNASTPTQQPIEVQTEIDQLLSNENDVLKFQYIMMVQEQDETKFMKNLLVDNKRQSIESMSLSQSKVKTPNYRIRDESQNDKRRYHDKFDTFDPYILQNVKRELQIQSKKRKDIFIKKQKQREELNQEIADKMQMRKVPIQSKEELVKLIQTQAYEREMKLRLVQQKKQENFVEKMHHLQQQICEKSPEFRYKKRLEIIRIQQNKQMFSMILTYLNIENVCQIMQETSQRGLELKRMMFKEHMKARIIQNTIRKRNIIKKIKSKLGLRQKKILLSFIFRFKIHFRIKSKYTYIRKINLFHLKSTITQKFRQNLVTITKKVKIVQQFCRWYNHIFYVQLSYLNYKWDEFLKQTFKGQATEKEREELKQHELHHILEKQQNIVSKLTTPLRSRLQILNDLKFPNQLVMKGTELRTNLLKKIKPFVQIDEEFKDFDPKFANRILLPYTKYNENIALSVAAKIRFDYQMMIQMQVHEKVFMEELNVKFEILKDHLARLRRDFIRQMKDFYSKLADCKDQHKQIIFDDKRNKMVKPDTKEYKILKSKDEQETKIILQKREMARRRNGQNIFMKDIIFNKIRTMPQDQYPFPNFTLKLIENMFAEIKPKFKLRMNLNEWTKLFSHYQLELKQRYLSIMNDARKVAAQRIKNLKQNKIKNKKKTQNTEQ